MTDQTPRPQTAGTRPGEAAEPAAVVERFFAALRGQDFTTAAALLDDAVVYQNVGLPTIRGARRTMALMRAMDGRAAFDVVIHRSAAAGTTVLNERTDALTVRRLRVQFWVCGVFEVHHGRITLWRDYFDAANVTAGLLRGAIGAAVPALRARF